LRLAPDNPQIGVAATANGHIFWGAPLQPSLLYDVYTVPQNGSASAIAMENAGKFYVATNASNSGTITRFTCFLGCTTETVWPQPQTPTNNVTAVGIDPLGTDTVLAAIQDNGIFRGTRDSSGKWTWVPYNNGIPVGANVTDIEARSDGSIAAATYGRSVFLLTSRSTAPPTLTAVGHVIEFEEEGDDSHPGKPIPKFTTAELDSKPGFLFTTTKLGGTGVLAEAFRNHRKVKITYTESGHSPSGQNTGNIISASYEGP
jgi:hypothetical protein